MKIIGFVKVISRTRYSKKYLNKIGVNGKRVALITGPMTYLFGRSHMRVSGHKMKKKRCVGKWCVIKGQLEIYKNGRFYKLSLKNCTIKPQNKKIRLKSFLFLIYNTMKKKIYKLPSREILLPNWLFKLVRNYGTPLEDVYFFNKNSNCVEVFYKRPGSIETCLNAEIFDTRDEAQKRKNELEAIDKYSDLLEKAGILENEKNEAQKEIKEMKEKIEDLESSIEYKNSTIRLRENTIEEMRGQLEELKSLPPIEIDHVGLNPSGSVNQFDNPQDENLTKTQKRGRSTWEK